MALNSGLTLPFRTGPVEDGDEDEAAEDEDELEDTFTSTGTFDDLVADAEVEQFDRTFSIGADAVPFAPNDAPAIPRPWQGIPRVAIVYNLNFVWDSAEERWIRDEGNGGATVEGDVEELPAVSNPSNDGWDTLNSSNTTVTFDTDFDNRPVVVAQIIDTGVDDAKAAVTNVTTTQADIGYDLYGTGSIPDPVEVAWMAMPRR